MFKNALVSVSNKKGIIEFIKPLAEQGMRVVSTGGTAKLLKEAGVDVVDISEQTGFPEVMDGRVKTLHPNVHMCLLARESVPADYEILKESKLEPFDLVVGNLYPFEEALLKQGSELNKSELVEFIDIGGPSFLRASAKNYSRIATVCDPSDYAWILDKGELSLHDRTTLAAKVFSHTSSYDSLIAKTLSSDTAGFLPDHSIGGTFVQELRYGENPSQKAAWYKTKGSATGLHQAEIIQGKALSFNNLLDLEAACSTLKDFNNSITCVSVKHNNPCGVATGNSVSDAVAKSLAADPVSVFGGIIAVNSPVDEAAAKKLEALFLECVVAPDFSKEALKVFTNKKNLRILKWEDINSAQSDLDVRPISGGYLLQEKDQVTVDWQDDWKVFGEKPNEKIKKDLVFAWKVCAHLKSNAIAVVENEQTLGLGMGQVNRVDAVEQSLKRMKTHHPNFSQPILASDAFFPFSDSIEEAHRAGVKWVIQPGGSIKDEEVLSKAKELGVNVVLTGQRHFLH